MSRSGVSIQGPIRRSDDLMQVYADLSGYTTPINRLNASDYHPYLR